ncbi:MAG TPA: hypothetical protein VKG45_14400 [Actinomycetes bacterium]|nr:hypothetical protein [Actinomycetes bacterium]
MPVQPSPSRPAAVHATVRPPVVLLALGALLALALAGCGRIEATVDTSRALRDAGIRDPVVTIETDAGKRIVTVAYASREPLGPDLRREQDLVARTVWRNANVRLDVVRAAPSGEQVGHLPPRAYSRAELTRRFGRRPGGRDAGAPSNGAIRAGVVVTVLVIVLGLTLALVGLYAWLRRRRRRPAAPPWLAGPAYPGWSSPDAGRDPYPPRPPEYRRTAPSDAGYPLSPPAAPPPAGAARDASWPAERQDAGDRPRPPTAAPDRDQHGDRDR